MVSDYRRFKLRKIVVDYINVRYGGGILTSRIPHPYYEKYAKYPVLMYLYNVQYVYTNTNSLPTFWTKAIRTYMYSYVIRASFVPSLYSY